MKKLGLLIVLFVIFGSTVLAWAHAPNPAPDSGQSVVRIELVLPENAPALKSILIQPDTLVFGEAGMLTLTFADESYLPAAGDLKPSAPWLQLNSLDDNLPADGVNFSLRAYQLDAFVVEAGELESGIHQVTGRVLEGVETAPIRMPRTWSTRWWVLGLMALALTLVVLALWWLWGRRMQLSGLNQWDPAEPAWLRSSVELRQLLDAPVTESHDPQAYLDRLASLVRRFLGRRYLVAAQELTGPEILTQTRLLGHDSAALRQLARLVDELDHRRYDPEPPTSDYCRQQAGLLFQMMDQVRIMPRHTKIDAQILLQGQQAWAWLEQSGPGLEVTVERGN